MTDYIKSITRRHVLERSGDGSFTGVAIAAQGRGHVSEGLPCADYGDVKAVGEFLVFALSDGHSSCAKSDSGALFAVESVFELIDRFVRAGVSEIDLLRLFKNRSAYAELLNIWIGRIRDAETSEKISYENDVLLAAPYGATLLAAVACPSFIICFAVGDGGFFLLKDDAVVNIMNFETIGDAALTSMCDLSADEFFFAAYPRTEYNGLMLMSDGLEQPWKHTGRFEKINELRSKIKGAAMDALLYDFITNHAHPIESDDVSLVFGEFEKKSADAITIENNRLLFTSTYRRKFKQKNAGGQLVTKYVEGGFRRALSPKTIISAALRLCDIFQQLDDDGVVVESFDEAAVIYDIDSDALSLDRRSVASPPPNLIFTKLYMEYYAPLISSGQKNDFFLSALLYKTLTGDALLGDIAASRADHLHHPEKPGFFEDFITNYNAALRGEPSEWRSPSEWKAEILSALCVCGAGLFDGDVCDRCAKTRLGAVEARSNGVSAPLTASEYDPSVFGLSSGNRRLFKTLSGEDAEGNFRLALLFPTECSVSALDGETWLEVTRKNSTGSGYIFDITHKRETVRINGQTFDFFVPSLAERTEANG
ncbi:MAG: protein phosphatase 2C domain-containing protein [Clostridiales bacterium]|jgi:hypothetical protein|nr:protein phosphatase 2C domain-containing protein [Clostridiales bacterium]